MPTSKKPVLFIWVSCWYNNVARCTVHGFLSSKLGFLLPQLISRHNNRCMSGKVSLNLRPFSCDAMSETIIYQAGLRTYINQVPIGHSIHSVSDTQSVNYTFILVKLFWRKVLELILNGKFRQAVARGPWLEFLVTNMEKGQLIFTGISALQCSNLANFNGLLLKWTKGLL